MSSELRYGTVVAVRDDYAVRVQFEDRGNIHSYWLRVLAPKTHRDKAYWPLDVGEHVACLVDEYGENGVILGALYGREKTPSGSPDDFIVQFANGDVIHHNRKSGDLLIRASGTITLQGRRVLANGSPVARIGDRDNRGDVMVTGAG